MTAMVDTNLFKKVACFTDIHFGRRGNDRQANQDNSDFIDWFITEAQAWGADTVICLGDWHDHRNNLNVSTLHYSLECMEKLSKAFSKFYLINGNHDLFYRDKREINSVEFGRNIDNCILVKEPMTIGNVTLMPWLVGDEWKDVPAITSKYIFGHFELPHFFMNAMIEMPDHGGLNQTHFSNQDYVFSGHFHKRQARGKIVYLGNVFPFNFADAWDDDRGAMFLEWDQEPFFKEWADAPKYRTMKVSELMDDPETWLVPKSYNRAALDVNMSYEEAQFVKDIFVNQFQVRKIDFVPINKAELDQEYDDDAIFQSIDQIVELGLQSVQSGGISNDKLIEIYRGLV